MTPTTDSIFNKSDFSQRFLLEQDNIRGEWVRLGPSLDAALSAHDYPASAETLLVESVLASVLMSSTLKFDGKLILQAQGSGPISLLAVEVTHERSFRAIARCSDSEEELVDSGNDLHSLLGDARLVITIAPDQGQRYQGIVPMEQSTLSQCLEQYFATSEQLPTFLFFATRGREAVGLILQKLPTVADQEQEAVRWEHIAHLARTLNADEVLAVDNVTLLHRLFHEEQVTLYPEQPVQFACSCSMERTRSVIQSLGEQEALHLLEDLPKIEIKCEFCSRQYELDRNTVLEMFGLPPTQ